MTDPSEYDDGNSLVMRQGDSLTPLPTPGVDVLEGLLERVKDASGPDREIDEAVSLALCSEHYFAQLADAPPHTGCEMYRIGESSFSSALRVTASVDAALALVERTLPRRWAEVLRMAMSELSNRFGWHTTFPTTEQMKLLPLAILSAFFSALIDEAQP